MCTSYPKKFELWVDFSNFPLEIYSKYNFQIHNIESVTFKMANFAFVNKGQNPCVIILILSVIDKCKMCHFECHGLNIYVGKFFNDFQSSRVLSTAVNYSTLKNTPCLCR